MKLSLVTGKVERDKPFQRLVDSILRETSVDWELVVADASAKPYYSDDPRIRVHHEKPRLTHSKGYNRAFRACRGEFILWLNDDAEVCPGYDVAAVAFMEKHPRIGLGCLHYSENNEPFHVNSAWGVMYANFGIFPRAVGDGIGYFDESISMYGADNSFTLKVLLADFGVADIPGARIIHHSEKDDIRERNQEQRVRDNILLHAAYMSAKRHWTNAYHRHRVPGGSEPWPHGVRPELAAHR